MSHKLRFLLLQIRKPGDPIKKQEVGCFARALPAQPEQILVHDLLTGAPTDRQLDNVDVVLIGGSGDFSVAQGGDWLEEALGAMKKLVDISKPTFASCWGFQAMALALGGKVVTDLNRAELGTIEVKLTPAGRRDPVFSRLVSPFLVQIGHQEIVEELPSEAICLASSARVTNEAFRIDGKPIYGTQFHPELDRRTIIERVERYPEYAEKILGIPAAQFAGIAKETPEQDKILSAFLKSVFG